MLCVKHFGNKKTPQGGQYIVINLPLFARFSCWLKQYVRAYVFRLTFYVRASLFSKTGTEPPDETSDRPQCEHVVFWMRTTIWFTWPSGQLRCYVRYFLKISHVVTIWVIRKDQAKRVDHDCAKIPREDSKMFEWVSCSAIGGSCSPWAGIFFSWDYKVETGAYTSWYAKQVGLSLQEIHDAES